METSEIVTETRPDTIAVPTEAQWKGIVATSAITLSIINLLLGAFVDLRLEFVTEEQGAFWTQMLVGLLMVISVLTVRLRGIGSLVVSLIILAYLCYFQIWPLL